MTAHLSFTPWLHLLIFLFSPLRPVSHFLWPASSPGDRDLTHRSGPVQLPASWAGTPPQSWEWCWCYLRWRRWAECWALCPSGSSRCFVCFEEAGPSTLSKGQKNNHLNFKLLPLKCFSGKLNGWTCTCYHYVSTRKLLPVQPANERMSSFLLTLQLIFCRVEARWKVKARAECFIFNFLCLGLERG